jgi:hypothetical protein
MFQSSSRYRCLHEAETLYWRLVNGLLAAAPFTVILVNDGTPIGRLYRLEHAAMPAIPSE